MTDENRQPVDGSDPYSISNPSNPNLNNNIDQRFDRDEFELADPLELGNFNYSLSQRIEQLAGAQGVVQTLENVFLDNDAPLSDEPLDESVQVMERTESRKGEPPSTIKDVILRFSETQEEGGIRDVAIHYDDEEVFPVLQINGVSRYPLGEDRITDDEADYIKSRLYPILNPVSEKPLEQMTPSQRYFVDALRLVATFVSGEGSSEDIESFFVRVLNSGESGVSRVKYSSFDASVTDEEGRQFDLHHYRSEGHLFNSGVVVEDGVMVHAYPGNGRKDEQLLLKYINEERTEDNIDDLIDAIPDYLRDEEDEISSERKTVRFYDTDPHTPREGIELSADEREKRAKLGGAVAGFLTETRGEFLEEVTDSSLPKDSEGKAQVWDELSPFEARIIDEKTRVALGVDAITTSKLKRLRNELAFVVS